MAATIGNPQRQAKLEFLYTRIAHLIPVPGSGGVLALSAS
jgi:hypothetical protein